MAFAADWSVSSGAEQASVVELFTSQGCSSCPPADRWLSGLKSDPELWKRVVPVAFHVTYWDYLGWRDPFANPANDARQRRRAADIRAGVYTPGVFLNQKEFRSWRFPGAARRLLSDDAVGVLAARAEGDTIEVSFTPSGPQSDKAPTVELTYLRTGLTTSVAAGENRGRELRHDFVAGDIHRSTLRQSDREWVTRISAPRPADGVAVALWLIDERGEHLQATGGWLPSVADAQR